MKSIRLAYLFVFIFLVSACGSGLITLPEGTHAKKDIVISDRPLAAISGSPDYVIPESSFSIMTNKTGSLAAGLLLGPVGVAANVGHVKQMAEEAAKQFSEIQPKNISHNLRNYLAKTHSDYNFKTSDSVPGDGILAEPAVTLTVLDDKTITGHCALKLSEAKKKSKVWSVQYRAQFANTISVDDKLYIRNQLSNDAVKCLNLALTAFRAHAENKFRPAYYVMHNGYEFDVLAYVDNEKSLYFSTDSLGVVASNQLPTNLKFR